MTKRLLAASAAVVLLAAAPDSDPWKRVPPLPTGAYQSDGYADALASAQQGVASDLERQEQINTAVQDKVRAIDPTEAAQIQQQYMLDHPQDAMKLMQRNQQLGETFSNKMVEWSDEQLRLDKDLEEIDARCKAELDKKLAPFVAKYKDLDKRAGPELIRGEAGDFYPPWAVREFNGIRKEENAAYEAFVPGWWGPSGPYQDWLKRWRELQLRIIPDEEEADDIGAGFMAQIIENDAGPYKSTAKLRAVKEYMDRVGKVFGKRWHAALKPVDGHEPGAPD